MVTVGFVVEGPSDKKLVESESFQRWLRKNCGLTMVLPIVDAGGNGQLCSRKITAFVDKLKIQEKNPDKVVVLADLDPDRCAPCISKRKEIIGNDGIGLIVIARKALESWFLADTEAMRRWTGNKGFYEDQPETLSGMPWDRLKEIVRDRGRGVVRGQARPYLQENSYAIRGSMSGARPSIPLVRAPAISSNGFVL